MAISAGSAALISAGIEAAAAGGTAAFNGIGASKRQKRAQRYYERNIKDQREYNEQYTRMMLHDTPSIEYQGMVDAGINPMLSNGADYSNVGINPADSSISAPEPEFSPLDFRSMAAPIQQAILNQAQVNNLNADTDKKKQELPQIQALTDYYKSSTNMNDKQCEAISMGIRETQERINNMVLTQELTKAQTKEIHQRIEQVIPTQIRTMLSQIGLSDSQVALNKKGLSVADSQIRLNDERAKSEYSRRQLNLAQTRQIEELCVKTMFEAMTGKITFQMASQTFASEVDKIIAKNQYEEKSSKRENAMIIDSDKYETYYNIASWYNEVFGTLVNPIGVALGAVKKAM